MLIPKLKPSRTIFALGSVSVDLKVAAQNVCNSMSYKTVMKLQKSQWPDFIWKIYQSIKITSLQSIQVKDDSIELIDQFYIRSINQIICQTPIWFLSIFIKGLCYTISFFVHQHVKWPYIHLSDYICTWRIETHFFSKGDWILFIRAVTLTSQLMIRVN